MNLQIKDIKLLFESGALLKAEIVESDPLWGYGFQVWFTGSNDSQYTIRTQRNASIIKLYKSLASATKAVQSIGFNDFTVKLLK